MAATLTQERFAGPDWVFERKLDGIRMLAFKHGSEVRLLSRNRLLQNDAYPTVVEAVARAAGARGDPRWRGHRGVGASRRRHIPRVRHHLARRARLDERCPSRSVARCSRRSRSQPPLTLVARLDDAEPWERACERGLGGRDREAARRALRGPTLAALVEDEVRGVAGARGRRVHRPAGLARRARRVAARLLRGRRLRVRRAGRHRHWPRPEAAAGAARAARRASRSSRARSQAGPASRGWHTGCGPSVVVQVAFIEWTGNGKMRHPRMLGVRTDKQAAEVVRETP